MGRRKKRRSEGRVAFHMEKAAVYNLKIFKFGKVGIVTVRKSVVLWKMERFSRGVFLSLRPPGVSQHRYFLIYKL